MMKYPKASAYIAYNVPSDGILEDMPLDDPSTKTVVVHPGIGAVIWEESEAALRVADQCIRKYLRNAKVPALSPTREPTWDLSNTGDCMGDRTVPTIFSYHPFVDERFFNFMASCFFTQFPDWRLLHVETSDALDLSLAIYPDAISVGHREASQDIPGELSLWRDRVDAYRRVSEQRKIQQLDFLESLLKSRTPSFWKSEAPSVLAVFDHDYDAEEDDEPLWTVWILIKGESAHSTDISAEGLMESDCFKVGRKGNLEPFDGHSSSTGLWLRGVVVPPANEIVIDLHHRNSPPFKSITISHDQVIASEGLDRAKEP